LHALRPLCFFSFRWMRPSFFIIKFLVTAGNVRWVDWRLGWWTVGLIGC
jgi:hypothetical protein